MPAQSTEIVQAQSSWKRRKAGGLLRRWILGEGRLPNHLREICHSTDRDEGGIQGAGMGKDRQDHGARQSRITGPVLNHDPAIARLPLRDSLAKGQSIIHFHVS